MANTLLLIAAFQLCFVMTSAGPVKSSPEPNDFVFATELFLTSCKDHPEKNVIISPLSIQGALVLVYLGARNKTEKELQEGLRLGDSVDKRQVAEKFNKLLKATDKGSAQVEVANKLYVKEDLKISESYKELVLKNSGSEAEQVNFRNLETVAYINKWVELKTDNKIQNILESIDEDTQMFILNVIYFKGFWSKPFDLGSTSKRPFFNNFTKVADVDTMYSDDNYKFGKISKLDATALELPYKDSELSMVFILPNKKDGLNELRENLKTIDIREILNSLTETSVEVFIPKFRIEFDLKLKSVLSHMGMETMFSDRADLSGLFESDDSVKVDDIQHKAFIDVNEAGSEAAAATIVKISLMSFNPNKEMFMADHPFIFFLKSKDSVYFTGQVISF